MAIEKHSTLAPTQNSAQASLETTKLSAIIQLIDAALAGDLSKNELKTFLALVRQTLCFGKTSDPLTIKRLIHLTKVRKDRLELAISNILNKGLFTRVNHPIFEHEYHVHPQFLLNNPTTFFAPSPPKIRENFRETDAFSENQNHTIQTNTEINLTTNKAPVCAVTPTAELKKPDAVHEQAFAELVPALKKLPSHQAQQVLDLVSLAIKDGSIKTTQQRLGGGLIKAAKNGTLDTSPLQVKTTEPPKPTPIDHRYQHDLISKIRGLENLKQLAKELDPSSEAQLQAWQQQLKQLTHQHTTQQEHQHG